MSQPLRTVRPAARSANVAGPAFPVSFAQQRLWLLQRMMPDSTTYTMVEAFRLRGELDVDALYYALTYLVERHEALRTRFDEVDGLPVQIVSPTWECRLGVVDLRSEPAHRAWTMARARIDVAGRTPFDLGTGPLFCAELIRLRDDDCVLILRMHHIISDGWSVMIMLTEISAVYNAAVAGRSPYLPELPIQYVDFACWQRADARTGEMLTQQRYWMRQLADAPSTLELPRDRPSGGRRSEAGGLVEFTLAEDAVSGLTGLAAESGATLHMALFAVFQTLLFKWSGRTDLVVGVPVAGRTRVETEGLIGFFVNTLALRIELADDPRFLDLLLRVRDTLLTAYLNQDLPFDQLVAAINPPRSLGVNPLIQVVFQVLDEYVDGCPELAGIDASRIPFHNDTGPFDLQLDLVRRNGSCHGRLYYSKDLFTQAQIRDIASWFRLLVVAIQDDPYRRISRFPAF
jgi:NRPS condensation-like uncharacterized protein